MNIFEALKQFKNITPDPAYKEKSKRAILATIPQEPVATPWSITGIRSVFVHIMETGVAVGLTVFFILIITGQFPNSPYASPVQFSVIDPQTLHAEAQAVDIQIQLAQVAYQEPTSTAPSIAGGVSESTTSQAGVTAPAAYSRLAAALKGQTATSDSNVSSTDSNSSGTASSSSASPSSTVSIDQALKALSE
jgi:hypothetical protein